MEIVTDKSRHDRALAEQLVNIARREGAFQADVVISRSVENASRMANGHLERTIQSESQAVGLRVFVGKRQSIVSFGMLDSHTMQKMAAQAVAMAKLLPEDPYAELLSPTSKETIDDQLWHPHDDGFIDQERRVQEMEDAALEIPSIQRTWSVEVSSQATITTYAQQGWAAQRWKTLFGRSVVAVAADGDQMERDYDYSMATKFGNLIDHRQVAHSAARISTAKLGARSLQSQVLPVVFTPKIMRRFWSLIASALSGNAVASRSSFLWDAMGQEVFSPHLTLTDDPWLEGGMESKLFDCEAQQTKPLTLIKEGVVQNWLLDGRSARWLGLAPQANGSRSIGSAPYPSSSNMRAHSSENNQAAMANVERGLLVSELIGSGFNSVTGDFSYGISGHLIERGAIIHPVNKMTIAGNMKDLFAKIKLLDDRQLGHTIITPSGMVDGLTISGSPGS
jgi:PmbA protein